MLAPWKKSYDQPRQQLLDMPTADSDGRTSRLVCVVTCHLQGMCVSGLCVWVQFFSQMARQLTDQLGNSLEFSESSLVS